MKKIALVLLAMVMLIAVPCMAFEYLGHEGQIPMCQNNTTGVLKFAKMKDIDPTANVDYEPLCNAKTETLIWATIQQQQQQQQYAPLPCTAGADLHTYAPWVVCSADSKGEGISHGGGGGEVPRSGNLSDVRF